MNPRIKRIVALLGGIIGIVLAVQYVLPLALPFLLGAALALAAEPVVGLLSGKMHMPRPLAAGIGVTMAFCFVTFVILLLGALAVRELRALAGILPDMEGTVRAGMDSLSGWLLGLARRAPAGIGAMLTKGVSDFFSGGAALMDRGMNTLLNLATGILSRVPDSALLVGTGIISSYMISAKLPKLKAFFREKLAAERLRPMMDSLSRMKSALGGWLKAQLKLCGLTFCLTSAGLFLLGIEHPVLWALLIALVDALPILGAGAALVPWSLVSFLQGDRGQAFGLLGVYLAVAVTRTVLEPRLVGRQLGLDPLVTLAALYAGYRLWGVGGMILAPMLAVAVIQLAGARRAGE